MNGIGGTDISAILGQNPWKSRFDVYLKCIGKLPEVVQNERMEWGLILETPISARYQKNHQEFMVVPHEIIIHQGLPYIKGSPDRVCKKSLSVVKGLEIKTAGWKTDEWGEDGTDDVPFHYLTQCQWYGGLFNGLDWDLAALFGGSEYHEYSIKYDAELYNMMIEQAVKFWMDHVEKKSPPEITYSDSSVEYVKRKYKREKLPLKQASEHQQSLIEKYQKECLNQRITQAIIEDLKIKIQNEIGDSEGLEFNGGKITWKTQKGCEYMVKKEDTRVLRISKPKGE